MPTDGRNRLRQIQDQFLALPAVQYQTDGWGWLNRIAGPRSPTFGDVRDVLWPAWEGWFRDFLGGYRQ